MRKQEAISNVSWDLALGDRFLRRNQGLQCVQPSIDQAAAPERCFDHAVAPAQGVSGANAVPFKKQTQWPSSNVARPVSREAVVHIRAQCCADSLSPHASCVHPLDWSTQDTRLARQFLTRQSLSARKTETKAFCGMFTLPNCFIFALPFFCFSSSFFFRVTSPP